jgi:peroxiredoxin
MSTASAVVAHGVRPRRPAPDLTVPLLSGGTYRLAVRHPDGYTMVVFFRGLHYPVCRAQLSELNRRLDGIRHQDIEVIAVSAETRARTEQLASEWKLDRLPLAYGFTEEQMRSWGLFVSHGINDGEPAVFSEPGLFLIAAGELSGDVGAARAAASDGTVYYESILSMPAGRPRLDDLLGALKYWREHDYPARGEA